MSFPEQAVRSLVITTGMKNAGKGNAAGYFPHGSAFPLPSTPHQNMTDEKMSTEGTNEIQDPRGEFRQEGYEQQQQKAPGLQSEMKPVPDSGEQSYHGCNRLRGRKALVTGGRLGNRPGGGYCLRTRRSRRSLELPSLKNKAMPKKWRNSSEKRAGRPSYCRGPQR